MEKIVCCMDCGYCEVDSWDAWCNKENAQLNDVCDEHKCDYFFPRIKKEESFQQLSKALCGKENATLDEMLEAAEQLKHRAEPENRPLTLEELKAHCAKGRDAEPLWVEFDTVSDMALWVLANTPYGMDERDIPSLAYWLKDDELVSEYGKFWRCWPRKPSPEQMAAEKWEE